MNFTTRDIFSYTNESIFSTPHSTAQYIWGYPTYFKDIRISKWIYFWIAGILLTLTAIFGIIGNVLSVSYLHRRLVNSKKSCYILLLALSYFDLIVCINALLFYGLAAISSEFIALDWYVKWICKWNLYAIPLYMLAYLGSTLITLAITVERLIVIFKPLQASSIITPGRTKHVVTCSCALAISLCIPLMCLLANRTLPYDPIYNTCEYGYVARTLSIYDPSSNLVSPTTVSVYNIFEIIHSTVYLWIPVPVITVANVAILIKIRSTYKQRSALTAGQIQSLRTTKKFLKLLILYVLCTIPKFCTVISILILGRSAVGIEIYALSDFTSILNCAVNYLVYCVAGKGFKDSFTNMARKTVRNVLQRQVIISSSGGTSTSTLQQKY